MRPGLKVALLLALYAAIALVPLVLAAAQSLPRRPWRDDLSSGLAMTAFAVLLLEFLLSGRYRAISARIGMDLTMRFHQVMAIVAFAFLILHPVIYSLPYAQLPPWDATRQFTLLLTPAATVSGLLGWIVLAVLAVLAQFRAQIPYAYETWRLSHGLGALAVAAFGTHHALDTGRYAQDPALRLFWLAACALAFVALVGAYVVKPLWQGRRRLRVLGASPEAERIWRVVLEPVAGPAFRFVAGQFVWLKFHRSFGRITEHPFSIASAPAQLPRLEFLIKEGGDFTGGIGRVPAGTAAFLDGPYGNFTLTGRSGEGIVLIAGGVGIAPILSIVRELAARGDPRPVRLVYADRTLEQLAAQSELQALARAPGFEVHTILAEPPPGWSGLRGRPDAANLALCLPRERPHAWLYFVCGPPLMIDVVERALAQRGVPLARIVSERFRYDSGIATPRERLTRAVIGALMAAQLAAALIFALR